MLRQAVLIAGVLLLFVGAIAAGYDVAGLSLGLLIAGGVMTVGTLCERVLYKPLLPKNPGTGWIKTEERFIDPDTGKTVDVFYDPRSGERQYVSQAPDRR
jgi:hypothetical protein